MTTEEIKTTHDARTFNLGLDLCTMLDQTDFKNISKDFLKLPFDFICFEFPRNFKMFKVSNFNSPFVRDANRAFKNKVYLAIQASTKNIILLFISPTSKETVFKYELPINHPELKTVSEVINEAFSAFNEDASPEILKEMKEVLPEDHQFFLDMEEGHRYAFTFIVKALLYINSENPDIRPMSIASLLKKLKKAKVQVKRDKIEERIRKKKNIFVVGSNILIDKTVKPKQQMKGMTPREVKVQFWVRGHWRNQPCGPDRSERKLIWIRPFLKGPDIADRLHRNYDVKAKEARTLSKGNETVQIKTHSQGY